MSRFASTAAATPMPISGLGAGYFVGWGGRLALRYYGVAQDERI
ncbi:hypothetical protein [Bradyrhizobium sp. CCGUVB1N3]|nr:hypothetical protein [Bradyrhizobium sp. CCGUVB1N3]